MSIKYISVILYFICCFLGCKKQPSKTDNNKEKQLEETFIRKREELQKIKEKENALILKRKLIKEKQELLAPYENTLNEADISFSENAARVSMTGKYPKWEEAISKYKKAQQQLHEIQTNKDIEFTKNQKKGMEILDFILRKNIEKLKELERFKSKTGLKNEARYYISCILSLGIIPLLSHAKHKNTFSREFGYVFERKLHDKLMNNEEKYYSASLEHIDIKKYYSSKVILKNQEEYLQNMCIAPDITWGFRRLMLIAHMKDELKQNRNQETTKQVEEVG